MSGFNEIFRSKKSKNEFLGLKTGFLGLKTFFRSIKSRKNLGMTEKKKDRQKIGRCSKKERSLKNDFSLRHMSEIYRLEQPFLGLKRLKN